MADDFPTKLKTSPIPWRRLLLPGEHGSWAFVLEPLALGLLTAASPAGIWLVVVVVLGFLSRKPARFAFPVADASPATLALRKPARWTLLGLLAGGCVSLLITAGLSDWRVLSPLLPGLPAVLMFHLWEKDGRTRSLLAELVATGICSLPLVSIALAGKLPLQTGLALAAANLARAWPSLLYVRAILRSTRENKNHIPVAMVAQIAAPALLALLAWHRVAPWTPVAFAALLALRALFFISFKRRGLSARQLGLMELGWGLLYVLGTAAAFRA